LNHLNCNYLIKVCVRLCNYIYSIDYWTQWGCLTWKLCDPIMQPPKDLT